MKYPEIAQNPSISEKVRKLLDGPPVNNYNYRQVQLIVEKFCIEHSQSELDDRVLSTLMEAWAGSEHSKAWGKLVGDPQFKTHPRFQGNYANVTLKDVQDFMKTGVFPKE